MKYPVFLRSCRRWTPKALGVLRNKAHQNVASLFDEGARREPEKDTLLLVAGLIGDYPNMMMVLEEDQLDEFKAQLHAATNLNTVVDFYLSYGTLRNAPDFWPALDWFVQWQAEQDPIGAGQFDLKHYFLTRLLSLGEADLLSGKN